MRAILLLVPKVVGGKIELDRRNVDSHFVRPSQHNLNSFLGTGFATHVRELNFIDVRGNVPTRVRKLFQLNADGCIVAKAAIDRLLEAEPDEFADTRTELAPRAVAMSLDGFTSERESFGAGQGLWRSKSRARGQICESCWRR